MLKWRRRRFHFFFCFFFFFFFVVVSVWILFDGFEVNFYNIQAWSIVLEGHCKDLMFRVNACVICFILMALSSFQRKNCIDN